MYHNTTLPEKKQSQKYPWTRLSQTWDVRDEPVGVLDGRGHNVVVLDQNSVQSVGVGVPLQLGLLLQLENMMIIFENQVFKW